jgi:ankyrin repeat protein
MSSLQSEARSRRRQEADKFDAHRFPPPHVGGYKIIAALCILLALTASAPAADQPAEPAKQKESAPEPDFPLMSAARSNDVARVKALLSQKAPEDQRNARLETALFIAASEGHLDVVRVLVDVPAGINLPDHEGRTPLFAAAAAGHREVVEFLLDNGAQPNGSRNNGESPLAIAVENKHLDVVRSLLKMGALSTSYDFRGRTPLLIAREQDNAPMIDLLLKANARMPDDRVPASVREQQAKPTK